MAEVGVFVYIIAARLLNSLNLAITNQLFLHLLLYLGMIESLFMRC